MSDHPIPADDESLVTVEQSLDPLQVETLRAWLEAEGIPAFAVDRGVNQVASIAGGGVRLMVPREVADEARRLIALIKSGQLAARDDDVKGGGS